MSTEIKAAIDLLQRYSGLVKRIYAATGGQLAALDHFHDIGGHAQGTKEAALLLRLLGNNYNEGLSKIADSMVVDLKKTLEKAPSPTNLIRIESKGTPGAAQNIRRNMRLQVVELVRTLEPLYTHMEDTTRWSTTQHPGKYPTLDGTQFEAFQTYGRHTSDHFLPELEAITETLIGMYKELSPGRQI